MIVHQIQETRKPLREEILSVFEELKNQVGQILVGQKSSPSEGSDILMAESTRNLLSLLKEIKKQIGQILTNMDANPLNSNFLNLMEEMKGQVSQVLTSLISSQVDSVPLITEVTYVFTGDGFFSNF
jgi:uncharacterized protein YjgD (DUF1641 family)